MSSPVSHRYRFKKRWKRILVSLFDAGGGIPVALIRFFKKAPTVNPKKILVVRIDSLGDALLSLPAIESLQERFPQAKIDFLAGRQSRELFRVCFPGSQILEIEKEWLHEGSVGFWKEFFKMTQCLKQNGYDLGVDFRGDLRTILLMTWAGIPERWGRDGTGGGFLLTHRLADPYQQHEIVENLRLVGSGSPEKALRLKALENLKLPPAKELLFSQAGNVKKVVIHVGAGYPSKRWPAENYVKVAKKITEQNLGTPIFIGSKAEGELLAKFNLEETRSFKNLTGRTSLEELVQLLKGADLYLGNDSGPAHLAAFLGVKMVVVFSGTNEESRWAPWSDRIQILKFPVPCSPCEEKVCPLERQDCLEEIKVEEVWRAVQSALSN